MANDLSASAVKALRRNLALNFPPDRPVDEWMHMDVQQLEEADTDAESNRDGSNGHKCDNQVQNPGESTSSQNATAPSSSATMQIHPDCKVHANEADAISLMYQHRELPKRFDLVDLDPYGTAAPFLDAAVQAVTDGGLLCVTCTDLAVLAGHNYPEKCFSLYGGVSIKAEYSHEVALRLVLHAISMAAGRYGRFVEPMLSLSIDFYLRVFVRVWSRPETVKQNASKTGLVYTCSKCSNYHIQHMGKCTATENAKTGLTMYKFGSASGPPTDTRCAECGGTFHVGGPMWLGPLHNAMFCDELLSTLDSGRHPVHTEARIRGMVSTARDELDDALFYFHPAKVAGLFHCASPAFAPVVHALLNAGYKVSRSHCIPGSVKTNASRGQVYDLYRTWIRTNPVNPERLKDGSAAKGLLAHVRDDGSPATLHCDFDLETEHPDTQAIITGTRSENKAVRYQMNPQANWGPGTAAKGHRKRTHRSLAPEETARRTEAWRKQREAPQESYEQPPASSTEP